MPAKPTLESLAVSSFTQSRSASTRGRDSLAADLLSVTNS
ncbi:hypothetical protein TIFTF001_023753 [Ficus carica]|uniref:Uncharacterized protein n=1 Tax=Ficus carica TaxID=3494 RepID=A0AA88AM92_FICCA|nr:hypothetical protein TIFTF001_023753 [Ficus carica]